MPAPTLSFSWKSGWWTTSRIDVCGGKVVHSSNGLIREFRNTLRLAALDPNDSSFTYRNYFHLTVGTLLLVVALTIWWVAAPEQGPGQRLMQTGSMVLSLGLAARMLYRYLSEAGDYCSIRFRGSGHGALAIPKRRETASPVARLLELIKQAAEHAPLGAGGMAGELEGLARLFEQGLLTEQEFRLAKDKLLGQRPPMGFQSTPPA